MAHTMEHVAVLADLLAIYAKSLHQDIYKTFTKQMSWVT